MIPCRIFKCPTPEECEKAQHCVSTASKAFDYLDFMTRDAMPTLKRIMGMIDTAQPVEHVRVEIEALRQRMNRTL